MDVAWERSALKHVAGAHTPTLILHGENDNDVPIAEAEQFFIALKDVGVETVFCRYPREGHGLSETKHQIDATDRSIAWYEKHFPKAGAEGVTNDAAVGFIGDASSFVVVEMLRLRSA